MLYLVVKYDAGFVGCTCLKRHRWFSSQVWKHHVETVQMPFVILIKLVHQSLPLAGNLNFISFRVSCCHCHLAFLCVGLSVRDKVSVALIA